jgi:hypothetical protein
MRFDNKDLGLFSNEAPKKKKRRIKITEEQYNRLFNINEEDEASTDTHLLILVHLLVEVLYGHLVHLLTLT